MGFIDGFKILNKREWIMFIVLFLIPFTMFFGLIGKIINLSAYFVLASYFFYSMNETHLSQLMINFNLKKEVKTNASK